MARRAFFPGEWGDVPPQERTGRPYFEYTGAIKPPPPVLPHTSFGRSYCNGKCRCGVATCHVGSTDKPVLLDWASVDDGAYVLELDEHRKPMAAPYEERFHDGWARYQLHVCAKEAP
jgi:hypothetical protein